MIEFSESVRLMKLTKGDSCDHPAWPACLCSADTHLCPFPSVTSASPFKALPSPVLGYLNSFYVAHSPFHQTWSCSAPWNHGFISPGLGTLSHSSLTYFYASAHSPSLDPHVPLLPASFSISLWLIHDQILTVSSASCPSSSPKPARTHTCSHS